MKFIINDKRTKLNFKFSDFCDMWETDVEFVINDGKIYCNFTRPCKILLSDCVAIPIDCHGNSLNEALDNFVGHIKNESLIFSGNVETEVPEGLYVDIYPKEQLVPRSKEEDSMRNTITRVVHSESNPAWNIVGTILGGKHKIARIPYIVEGCDNITVERNKKEALEHAIFISRCFNSGDSKTIECIKNEVRVELEIYKSNDMI